MYSPAAALDAADGRMDGRFFGSPIVGGGYGVGVPAAFAPAYSPCPVVPYSGIAAPAAYGAYAPATYGAYAPATYGAYAPAASSALALDAADGRIDGRFFGSRIVGGGYGAGVAPAYGAYTTPAYGAYGAYAPASSALALDAADGRIDGRYFGSRIVGGGYGAGVASAAYSPYAPRPAYAAAAPVYTGAVAPYTGAVAPYTGTASSALALDAADGRIDGRYFGSRIVGGGYGAGVAPAYSAYSPYAARAYPTPAYGTYAPAYGTYAPAYGAYAPASAALALDAADGRIDGRFFGSQIVGGGYGAVAQAPISYAPVRAAPISYGGYAPAYSYGGYAAPAFGGYTAYGGYAASPYAYGAAATPAAQLDAADGVMDGRHFGSRIVGGGYGAGVAPAFSPYGRF
eukprot:NODE_2002_length_1308_cov_229.707028_g1905_i0.p1 GENE.NODE_2002_length_1308_cov_229.707028_g1905_i0~~NODE_2002_length_1308_cov_229.707028_g1905_i0.p1  ORF type:complete len:416 (+),score=38.42 NODE_2002_length_1308_cov_229.707028_g1905_i0:49-1248(+)